MKGTLPGNKISMTIHIKDLLSDFFNQQRKDIDIYDKIRAILNKSIDKKLQDYIYLQKVYKDKIVFNSKSSSHSYEFNLKKNSLLKEIRKEFPQIKELKVRIG